jgi:hypothetical protein
VVLLFSEDKRSNKIETIQYFKKCFFITSFRISRPIQKHMKHIEFLKKCQNHWTPVHTPIPPPVPFPVYTPILPVVHSCVHSILPVAHLVYTPILPLAHSCVHPYRPCCAFLCTPLSSLFCTPVYTPILPVLHSCVHPYPPCCALLCTLLHVPLNCIPGCDTFIQFSVPATGPLYNQEGVFLKFEG